MAFGTKIGEVYAEVFVKINEGSRKAALAGIASEFEAAFGDAFNDIDKRSTKSTNVQVSNSRRASKEARKGIADVDKDTKSFFQKLVGAGKQGETTFHRLATQARTVGTIFRALSIGAKVIAGSNLLLQAFQGMVAAVPIVQAGLIAIPALVAAAGAEALILKVAFKGVGAAIKDGLDPAKAKQFNEELKKLTPAAQTFVRAMVGGLKKLPNIQEIFFSQRALEVARSNFFIFIEKISGSIKRLAAANGNLVGKIFGTATGSSGAKLTSIFLNNVATLLRKITPGLQAITHGFQILIAKVSGEGASRAGSLNGALEEFGHFLAKIDVHGIFDKATVAMSGFKKIAGLAWDIIKGIVRDLGGQQQVSNNFFTTVERFLGHVLAFINSTAGKQFVQQIVQIIQSLGSSSASLAGVTLGIIGVKLQLLAAPLNVIAGFAIAHPTAFKDIAAGILVVVAAWKIFTTAARAAKVAAELLDVALNANLFGVIVVAILAVAAAYFELFKHLDAVRKFLQGPWGIAIQIATVVLLPFIGIPLVIIANWSRIINFFTGPFKGAMLTLAHSFVVAGQAIVNGAIVTVRGVIGAWNAVWHFFVSTLPGAAKVLWAGFVHFGAIIVSNAIAVGRAVTGAWTAVWRFFVVTLPGAAKVMWGALVHFGAAIISNALAVVHSVIGAWNAVWRLFVVTIPGAAKVMWGQIVRFWNLISHETGVLTSAIIHAFGGVVNWWGKTFYGALRGLEKFGAGIWHAMSNAVGVFTSSVVKAFGSMVNTIRTVWGKIEGFVGAPIKWIINNVYNNGIAKLWNAVSGVVGHVLGTLGNIKLNFATGGAVPPNVNTNLGGGSRAAFATGGRITGPGGEREDLVPAMLSHGEYVINAKTVRQLGTSFFDNLNYGGHNGPPYQFGDMGHVSMTDKNFRNGGILHLKDGGGGGIFGDIGHWISGAAKVVGGALGGSSKATPTLAWLKSIAGRIPYRLGANGPSAYDCSSLVGAVWARLTGHNPYKRYFVTGESENSFLLGHGFKKGVRVKDSLLVGQTGEHTVGVLDGHRFEAAHTGTKMRFDDGATNALNMPQKYWMPAAGGGLLGGVLGFIEKLAGKGLQYMSKPILSLLGKVPGLKNFKTGKLGETVAGTRKGDMMPAIINTLGNAITKQADHAEAAAEAALAAAGSGGSPSNLALGKGKFNSWAAQASRFVDIPASWLRGLLFIMEHESGGNPNAVNHSDSNARAGHPSQGLMQLIPSTYNANVPAQIRGWGIRNPVANLAAAVNYIHRKYGSVYNTPWYHGQTFYNQGGLVEPQLFDKGGILSPGYTLALNKTGHNEYVSTGEDGGMYKDLHVHFMDKDFVAHIDDRIAKHDNAMINYIVTRHN